MKRKIVEIKQNLCNGCGLCVSACHEKAIILENGKAKLIHDQYCDGLGDCLPACPTGAIRIIEREALAYNEAAVAKQTGICPGLMAKIQTEKSSPVPALENIIKPISELRQWPIQLTLISPDANYLNDAELLFAADCTAFAYANIHQEFIKNRITIICCPKLDDKEQYLRKLVYMFTKNKIRNITILRMEVPCCSGLTKLIQTALAKANSPIPVNESVVSLNGELL